MNQKDTIYVDVEDEITTIIDKVKNSSNKLVALVMPKRSSVLQSTVNMKLLKRAADSSKKQLVLITAETSLLPLAAEIGLPVAKNLQSKPAIPVIDAEAEHEFDELLKVEEPGTKEDFDPKADADKSVGELSEAATGKGSKQPVKPELTPRPIPLAGNKIDDAIDLDNTADESGAEEADKQEDKKPRNKKLRIPDFNKFRLRLFLAVLVIIILIVGWIMANDILPRAKIVVYTNTSSVNVNLNMNLSTAATTVNATQLTVPTQIQTTSKSQSATVPTTGQKNEGSSATGSVTMTGENCNVNQLPISTPPTVPAGWAITSAGGQTFITQQATVFSQSSGKLNFTSGCYVFSATNSTSPTPVTAQNPGSSYNIGSTTWTVSGRTDVTASSSSPMTGGSDNIVQTVSQTDVNNAIQKLAVLDTTPIKTALATNLTNAGMYPITGTFSAAAPTNSNSATVGAQADTVSVTQTTVYTMFGVQKSSLIGLIDNAVNQQINTSTQSVFNNGFSSATYTASNQSSTGAQVDLTTAATVGPNLNAAKLKSQVAGQKAGDVESLLSSYTGVTKVTVHYSPFWVSATPKNINKISIAFEKSS
ncbi:MAG TPA: hypothetical protein VMR08_01550 [Patescibacteria group bacterium]|jgi:hypothetical protein|nr:hypothetical protein [Patescibacteria group bacterium]